MVPYVEAKTNSSGAIDSVRCNLASASALEQYWEVPLA
jgi:hypothetical protein